MELRTAGMFKIAGIATVIMLVYMSTSPEAVVAAGPFTTSADGDAEVREASPTTNYGSDRVITVAQGKEEQDNVKHGLIEFETPSTAGTITLAWLHLKVKELSPEATGTILCYEASDEWSEGSVTWNTQPPFWVGQLQDSLAAKSSGWMDFDVTDHVDEVIGVDDQVAFGLKWYLEDTEDNYWIEFYSSEAQDSNDRPYLEWWDNQ